jgi:hypothetical protein
VSKFAPTRTSYDTGDSRWNRDGVRARAHGVTITAASAFKSGSVDGTTGLVKSGSLVIGQGLLKSDVVYKTGEKHLLSVIHETTVDRRFLPVALTAAEEASLKGVTFINGTVPS